MNSNESQELGNIYYLGNYAEVILRGERYIKKHPDDAGVHVMLMDSYFKMRVADWSNVQRSADHAKDAILLGHDTGYCHERLLKNLREMEQYHRALQLCNIVLRPDFEFSSRGCGNKEYFAKAKIAVQKQINRGNAKDNPDDIVFKPKQISFIIKMTRAKKKREDEARKLWKRIDRAYESGRDDEYKRLLEKYHQIQQTL